MKGRVFCECLLMDIFPTVCPHGQGRAGVRQIATAAGRGRRVKNH